jgi:hypothetical protein
MTHGAEVPRRAGLGGREGDGVVDLSDADGRVILQGRAISPQERETLSLPADGEMISVDRNLIRAIKEML